MSIMSQSFEFHISAVKKYTKLIVKIKQGTSETAEYIYLKSI